MPDSLDNLDEIRRDFIKIVVNVDPALSPEAVQAIADAVQVHRFPKNTMIVSINEVNDRLFFIHSGLAYGFYKIDQREVTSWFVKENDFIYIPDSFLDQKPSKEAIETLEDSVVISLAYDKLAFIYDTFPVANKIGRILTEGYLKIFDKRVRSLRMQSAETRFKNFIENYPGMYSRLPQKIIASYLGISPETASRILKRKNWHLSSWKLIFVK